MYSNLNPSVTDGERPPRELVSPLPDPVRSPGLADRARQAVAWTAGFNLFRDVLQFGLMLTLVRLLPAEVYGQYGLVIAVTTFFTLYSFREFLNHTLQVRDDEVVHYQDHFTAGVVIQLVVVVVINLVAVGFRFVPAYAPVSGLVHLASLLFLLDLPSEFRIRMLERSLDWRRLRFLNAIGLIASATLSIVLAFRGWGVYALVAPLFVVPIPFIWDLFVLQRFRPTWQFSWDRFRPAWRFGSSRITSVSFVSGASLLESLWLTRAAGFVTVGLLGRAVGLTALLCGRVASLLALSIYPVLTRIPPRSDAFRRASAVYIRSVGWVVIPAAALASQLAEPIVRILYGPSWADVGALLPWTMAGGAVVAVVHTTYILLLAHGRHDRCLLADIWRLAGTALMLFALLPFGMSHYLGGLIGVHLTSLVLVMYWLMQDEAVTLKALVASLVPPIVGAAAASGAIQLLTASAAGRDMLWELPLQIVVFGVVYLGVLRLFYRGPLEELVQYAPARRRVAWFLRFSETT